MSKPEWRPAIAEENKPVVSCELEAEVVKVRYRISTDNVGSECSDVVEIDKEYWDSLTDDGKDAEMKEAAFEHLAWSYEQLD